MERDINYICNKIFWEIGISVIRKFCLRKGKKKGLIVIVIVVFRTLLKNYYISFGIMYDRGR